MREYAAALRAAVIRLDQNVNGESELLNSFLSSMPAGANFMGWWPEEVPVAIFLRYWFDLQANQIILYNDKKSSLPLYCFAAILFSCKEHESSSVETIEINPNEAKEEINLSEFIDSVEYIKLQTDSNCIMGRVGKILISEFN